MSNTTERETRPASWPLLFTHKSTVLGKGYVAKIDLTGRLLAELEVEGVWLYGVNPGAIAVGAATLSTANVDLHKALTAVFVDFAEQAATFTDFQGTVRAFFDACDDESRTEWEHAVARMKASTGAVEAPGGLPIKDAVRTRVYIDVAEQTTDALTARDNPATDCQAADSQLAAAA